MRKTSVFVLMLLLADIAAEGAGDDLDLYMKHQLSMGDGKVNGICFSEEGELLAFGDGKGRIFILETATGELRSEYSFHGDRVRAVQFSPDGEYIASASEDRTVCITRISGTGGTRVLKGFEGKCSELAFSSDGRRLAGDGADNDIFIWEIPSGHLRSRLNGNGDDILELAFDMSSGRIISIDRGRNMKIYDTASMKLLRSYTLEARTIPNSGIDLTCATISPDKDFAAAGIDEHILQKGGRSMLFKYHIAFFDLETGMLLKLLEDNNRAVDDIAIYPGNCFVAFDNSTLQEKKIAMRNIETADFSLQYSLDDEITAVSFSPDGSLFSAAVKSSPGPVIYVWDVDYEMPASGCFSGRIRLTSSPEPVIGPSLPRAAAVLPFSVSGTGEDLGDAASHFLESRLADNRRLKLVERSRVEEIIKELKFQQSGMADSGKAAEIGRVLGAYYIITGNVDRVGSDLVISVRVIRVETGEILGVREAHCGQCGSGGLYDAIDILAPAIAGDQD